MITTSDTGTGIGAVLAEYKGLLGGRPATRPRGIAAASLMHAGGVPGRVSASIGISVYPDDAEDIEALVDCADQAMYRSKRAGGGCYSFFSTLGSGPSAC